MKQEPQALADAIKTHLVAADQKLSNLLGMVVEEMTPNRVVCSMIVRDDMVNSHFYCQGGLIFTLADQAFAYACMSSNKASVTLSAQIIFTHPAKLGDTLTATAQVITESGRTATCDVTVTNQEQKVIARCSGVTYRMKKPLVEGLGG